MYGLPANFPLTAPIPAISGQPRSGPMFANRPMMGGAPGAISPIAIQQVLRMLRGAPPAGIQAFQGQPPGAPGAPAIGGPLGGTFGPFGGIPGSMGGPMTLNAGPRRSAAFSLY